MIIQGGTGNGYAVKVTRNNQIYSYSTVIPELGFISFLKQDGYTISSALTDIATGSCVLFFRNTDPQRNFYTHKIILGSSIATQFEVYQNSVYVVGAGTTIIPVNLAAFSGRQAICTALGQIAVTTVTPGSRIARYYGEAGATVEYSLEGAPILGLNNDIAIFVTNASSTNTIGVTLTGYYKDVTSNV
jgi:hypothetical protein